MMTDGLELTRRFWTMNAVLVLGFAVVVGTTEAHASLIGVTGGITAGAPPASILPGATESNTSMLLFQEQASLLLSQNVTVQITTPTTATGFGGTTPGSVLLGTPVDVFFLHHDPVGTASVTQTGSMTFDQDILGVILFRSGLDATDSILGFGGTTYGSSILRGTAEPSDPTDVVTLSGDLRTLTVTSLAGGFIDQVRVITAVPEPNTLALLTFGLILTSLHRRRTG